MRAVSCLAAATLALAACQSDEEFKQQWRQATIDICLQESQSQPMPAGIDANRVCSCSIDRLMQGKTVADLRANPAMQQEAEAAARQCALEAVTASVGPSPDAATTSAGNQSR